MPICSGRVGLTEGSSERSSGSSSILDLDSTFYTSSNASMKPAIGSASSPEQSGAPSIDSAGGQSPSGISSHEAVSTTEAFEDAYRLENVIGCGSYASVFRCVCRHTGENFAVKVIDDRQLSSYQRQLIRNEEAILRRLEHHNVIRLVAMYVSRQQDVKRMVFEFADQLDVCLALVTSPNFGEVAVKGAVRQLFEGLHYLHTEGIVHRDLKLENLLVKSGASSGEMVLKICDFGYAVKLAAGQTFFTLKNTIIGSFEYMSPELVSSQEYSAKLDWWAAGVIVYFLFTGDFPFKGGTVTEMARNIVKRQFTLAFDAPEWAAASRNAVAFVRSILEPLYTRPSPKELLKHPWFNAPSNDPRNVINTDLPLPIMLQRERLQFLQNEAEAKIKRLYNNSSSDRVVADVGWAALAGFAERRRHRSRYWRGAHEAALASEFLAAAGAAVGASRRCRSLSVCKAGQSPASHRQGN